jgi:hypothetical protein
VVNLSAAEPLLLLDMSAIVDLVCSDISGLLAKSDPLSLVPQFLTNSIISPGNLRFSDESLYFNLQTVWQAQDGSKHSVSVHSPARRLKCCPRSLAAGTGI